MLRKISGPKKDEVTVEWIRLHNMEILFFFYLLTYSMEQSPS